jgi:hypothetical protein
MDPVTQLLGTLTSLGFSEIEDTNGKQIANRYWPSDA